MKDFSTLTPAQQMAVHEQEMRAMKSDIRNHEKLIEALLATVARLVESTPGELTELASELRSLLFDRQQIAAQRDPWYYR